MIILLKRPGRDWVAQTRRVFAVELRVYAQPPVEFVQVQDGMTEQRVLVEVEVENVAPVADCLLGLDVEFFVL